jgi:hypothetical protein
MADEDWYARQRPSMPVWRPRGELLWEFAREADRKRFRCELRDGGGFSLDAQIFEDDQVIYNRVFTRAMDPTRTPRQLAVEWAMEERRLLQRAAIAPIAES